MSDQGSKRDGAAPGEAQAAGSTGRGGLSHVGPGGTIQGAGPSGVPSEHFHAAYEGAPPWDIDRPQPAFVEAAPAISGSLLDVGCGTGQNALYFAERGLEVWGVDMVPAAIEQARARAQERGISATFQVADALHLERLSRRFDHIIDSGLFHVFSDTDRPRFVASLASALNPGGVYHVLCFSEHTPGVTGPRRVTRDEIHAAFSDGWQVLDIIPAQYEVQNGPFPQAWFATIRRS